MASKYIFTEKQIQELTKAAKTNKNNYADKRLRALLMRARGKKLGEIASATGYSFGYTVKLVSKYREGGLAAIVGNHYRGNHRNMSYEEESVLLEPFRMKAEAGQIVKISEIEAVYREAVGHSIGTAQIYYVLRRHGWGSVMPQSKHPKKTNEAVGGTPKNQ